MELLPLHVIALKVSLVMTAVPLTIVPPTLALMVFARMVHIVPYVLVTLAGKGNYAVYAILALKIHVTMGGAARD